jgi:hypothetical protein
MCGAVYGNVYAVCLAERLLRQSHNLRVLGERTSSICEAASLERGKRSAEESSRL